MVINLHCLDQIQDYDQAIAALEGFVEELVLEFVESPEGKSYLKAHPEMEEYVGSWIDNLLYFGYAYESVTLPQMTKDSIEVIVTQIFPNKISLLDPEEANSTIPELMAFWQFLKREYKHPHAHKIIKFLKQVQPKFKDIMNDPQNFGIAKSFMMAGIAQGFDMTTEEGLLEFQQQHNQKLRSSDPDSLSLNLGGLLSGLDLVQDLGLPAESLQAELSSLLNEFAAEMTGEELSKSPIEVPSVSSIEDFRRQFQAEMGQKLVEKLPELSAEAIAILKQQQISKTAPGTILQDFQALLDFIGDKGIAVSGKRHLIPMKSLAKFNQQLSEPIQTDLQRPQQKSYPSINGLYLLLRASGLGQITQKGKKMVLTLNEQLLTNWNQLNFTERYFNLLEAWLIIANEEMLGERRTPLNEGTKCLQYWSEIPPQGQKIKNYESQQNLRYYPEFHNLALMKLFGLVEADYGKPQSGKGWRVKSVKKTSWGEALMQSAFRGFVTQEIIWGEEEDTTAIKFGKLQPALQPYFPEWQNVLEIPEIESEVGVYIFKVTLGKVWRRIAISSQMTLWDLSRLILNAVDFDDDHLDMFRYKNQFGRTIEISHPYADGSLFTDKVKIGDLPLVAGALMEYIFDFGDWWEFQLQLEEIKTDDLRPDYGEIIASKGKAPQQYPDWE
ncbi:plasmid pRiA4b ORF-3 family protein [Pleurocapsa sp. PCC 7319]|uniref:plasmid pRiA4b ORF-3 family protein n=1 Tax=Pleurocapsa sp. PCC 7319 TaxID=118161 RepID=UPI00034DF3BB|nr:plasmid pRiA4b ORF-3 family protein [Pleurocapsa sp. PCC 7319]